MKPTISLGLDFGTESARAILVDTHGTQFGESSVAYRHGQILHALPGGGPELPERFALQSPDDWLESAASATRQAMKAAGIGDDAVVGIGVAFTSCTMLPTKADGEPLCRLSAFTNVPLAWPKLWKHHGAIEQTARMNQIAQQRGEKFLGRYGGTIGLEWFFPKLLETIELAPEVAQSAEVWLEAGDWLVWQLVGGNAETLTRSTCQAGYKAMWSASDGYPSQDYFAAVHPDLAEAAQQRLSGVMRSPGERAGVLTATMAELFGLQAGTPVSAAIIDAHAAVPGVGAAEPGTLVMVMGTSSCHMLNAEKMVDIPGVAGIVQGGILPGFFGYETGQAAVGDAFAWLRRLLGLENFESVADAARALPPGAEGVMCLDWMNGCRTPLMDGSLRGAFVGLGLAHGPEHLYQALMEASAFGLRWIVEMFRDAGVPIERMVATGGLPHHNRAFVEVYADVLQHPIEIHPSTQATAVGAAVLGMVVAGEAVSGFSDIGQAAASMSGGSVAAQHSVFPRADRAEAYDVLYAKYRRLAANSDFQTS